MACVVKSVYFTFTQVQSDGALRTRLEFSVYSSLVSRKCCIIRIPTSEVYIFETVIFSHG